MSVLTARDSCCRTEEKVEHYVKTFSLEGWEEFQRFNETGCFEELISRGLIPETETDSEALTAIQKKLVPVVYPFEWSPAMVKTAALFVLDLENLVRRFGYTIKDPSPYNVVFDGASPKWVDLGSFMPLVKVPALWVGYQWFICTFLASLVFAKNRMEHDIQVLPLAHPRGISLAQIWALLPAKAKVRPSILWYFGLGKLLLKSEGSVKGIESRFNNHLSGESVIARGGFLVKSLRRFVERFSVEASASQWGNYYSCDHLSGQELNHKLAIVCQVVDECGFTSLVDFGGNTGRLTQIDRTGFKRIVIDGDRQAIDIGYSNSSSITKDTFIWNNLSYPRSINGFIDNEFKTLSERLSGSADLVVMYAIIHHLVLVENIAPSTVVKHPFIASAEAVLLEIPRRDDPMVRLLISQRVGVYDYHENEIMRCFLSVFSQCRDISTEHPTRPIYLFSK